MPETGALSLPRGLRRESGWRTLLRRGALRDPGEFGLVPLSLVSAPLFGCGFILPTPTGIAVLEGVGSRSDGSMLPYRFTPLQFCPALITERVPKGQETPNHLRLSPVRTQGCEHTFEIKGGTTVLPHPKESGHQQLSDPLPYPLSKNMCLPLHATPLPMDASPATVLGAAHVMAEALT